MRAQARQRKQERGIHVGLSGEDRIKACAYRLNKDEDTKADQVNPYFCVEADPRGDCRWNRWLAPSITILSFVH
jgi:hypothetical protein